MGRLFPYEVVGDGLEPKLRGGDFLLCEEVEHYSYARLYVMKDGAALMAEKDPSFRRDVIHLWHPNPLYGRQEVSRDWFNANVRGAVVAEINVKVSPGEFRRLVEAQGRETGLLALAAA